MGKLTKDQDAFGRAIHDCHRNGSGHELVERDDGFVDLSSGPHAYFAEYRKWPKYEREAIKLAKGRVLDVGCGAGRCALYLQQKGLDVLGIDISPLAIRVCKLRGLRKAKEISITQVTPALGTFDTIIMFGNNFGLFGSFKQARWLLKRFHGMTSPDARIVAATLDPYQTKDPCHLQYHVLNRKRGRMGGQVRIRIRYRTYATPWFDYLFVSREELGTILDGTGWRLARTIDSDGPEYAAVLEKR